MLKLETIADLRAHLTPSRRSAGLVGFVPTMGALHEGHRSLMRIARRESAVVVASIFVNPTQFGPSEDFEKYPRPLEADLVACRQEGVDFAFVPEVGEIYPVGAVTRVTVSRLTEGLCGRHRPGHFDGVTTVVAKLFNIVQPDRAYFGQKDAQQVAVIQQMVRDLLWPLEIIVCPTVRESDGLAMSSRNAYLSPSERTQATSLNAALHWAKERIELGEREVARLTAGIRERIEGAGPCTVDYIEVVDARTLEPRTAVIGRCLIALAVRIGTTRLIDNVLVDAGDAGR